PAALSRDRAAVCGVRRTRRPPGRRLAGPVGRPGDRGDAGPGTQGERGRSRGLAPPAGALSGRARAARPAGGATGGRGAGLITARRWRSVQLSLPQPRTSSPLTQSLPSMPGLACPTSGCSPPGGPPVEILLVERIVTLEHR